jgi:hypothetical protein
MIYKCLIGNKKGNALLLAILVLIVLGALGIGQLTSMITGARQSQVLFKGIDANFLLEGIVQEAESRIRGEANDYAKEPEWFKIFRDTNIGSTSAWKNINLGGSQISVLAKEVDAEIKVKARFFSQGPHRRNGKKDGEKVNFGKEKLGQLEIIAEAKIGDNYYHAHAAKDVKVINPLTLSYNGNYNMINDYTMFIKYAMAEYQVEYPFKDKNGQKKTDPAIKFGNYLYNRYVDERKDDISNDFYFVRLMNGGKSGGKGKVYLGSPKDMRTSKYKIMVDLPRGGYGGYYNAELNKQIYKLNPPVKKDYTKKVKAGLGSKTITIYSARMTKDDKDYAIIKSIMGASTLKNNYKQLYDAGVKNADHPSPLGSDEAMRVGAGEWLKNVQPAIVYRTIDGWEYATSPWETALVKDTPGKAYKTDVDGNKKFNVKSPSDWEDFIYVGLNPYSWNAKPITGTLKSILNSMKPGIIAGYNSGSSPDEASINVAPPFLIGSTYLTYFMNSPENISFYNSIAHSSFIDNDTLDLRNNNDDYTNHGFRGHPVLQLNGAWKNGKWMSETQVEGNVYARYMEGYYLKFTRSTKGDTMEVATAEDLEGVDTEEIPLVTMSPPEDVKEPSPEERFQTLIETSCDGPVLRYNNASNYNTIAKLTPYNKGGVVSPTNVVTPYNNGISDPDYANLYLDKITALYVDYRDFAHHNIKMEGDVMHIYLNGVYLINSGFPLPISDGVKEMRYHGKGVIMVAGDVLIKTDLKKATDHDLLILATIGKRDGKALKNSFIRIDGGTDSDYLRIEASLYAMNRDYYDEGKNMGMAAPCFISFAFGTQVFGNWAADWMYYFPGGTEDSDKNYINNNSLRGTLLEYDTRLKDKSESNTKNYLADISQPYAFWMVWKNKQSEI